MASIKDFVVSWLAQLNTVPGVAFVDVWNDQVKEEIDGETFAFPLPAYFLEIKNPENMVQLGRGVTQSNIDVDIHIMMDKLNNVDQGLPDGGGAISQNLDIFDLKAVVATALFGFKPAGGGIFYRTKREQDFKHTNVYHGVIGFKGAFIDTTGSYYDPAVFAKNYQSVTGITPVITVTETTKLSIESDIAAEVENDIDFELTDDN